jgi:hypothetical protein
MAHDHLHTIRRRARHRRYGEDPAMRAARSRARQRVVPRCSAGRTAYRVSQTTAGLVSLDAFARSKDATPSPLRSSHFHPWWCTPLVRRGCALGWNSKRTCVSSVAACAPGLCRLRRPKLLSAQSDAVARHTGFPQRHPKMPSYVPAPLLNLRTNAVRTPIAPPLRHEMHGEAVDRFCFGQGRKVRVRLYHRREMPGAMQR